MDCFFKDEEGFIKWCKENKGGFVFNFFQRTYPDNIIHYVDCIHLWYKHNEGKRTTLRRKFCSSDIQELINLANELCRDSWKFCRTCQPIKNNPF